MTRRSPESVRDGWLQQPATSGTVTRKQWRELLEAHQSRCAYCGAAGVELGMDHMEPVSRGGADDIANIIPACRPCNSAKGRLFPLEWACVRVGLLRRSWTAVNRLERRSTLVAVGGAA